VWAGSVCVQLLFVAVTLLSGAAAQPPTLRRRALALAALRVLAAAIVTTSTLLPQPVFYTLLGGTFSVGDVARSATLRIARAAWRASADHDCATAMAAAVVCHASVRLFIVALKRSRWSTTSFVAALSLHLRRVSWIVVSYVLWLRLRSDAVNYITAGWDPTSLLA
jgi:hypothetical protein